MRLFDDPCRLERHRRRGGEDRWQVIGRIERGICVAITRVRESIGGEDVTRILSSRKATSHEWQDCCKNSGLI
ncbi:MAG: BrnT family toxin [Rhodospirillales bacterium]